MANLSSEPPNSHRNRRALVVGVVITLACVLTLCAGIPVSLGIAGLHYDQIDNLLPRTALRGLETATSVIPTILPTEPADLSATSTPIATPIRESVELTPTVTVQATLTPTTDALTTTAVSPVPVVTTQRQVRIFTKLWNIVNTNYIYPDFNGVDWQAELTSTLQQINKGMDDALFYDVMRKLVVGLNDDHSIYLSPDEVRAEETDYLGTGSYVGVGLISDINSEKKYTYVLQVLPRSPAQQAGIRPHDHILEIDGLPSVADDGGSNMPLLRGTPGTTVTVLVSTPGEPPRSLIMMRAALSSTTPIESRMLVVTGTKRIGYILIPTLFEESVGAQLRDALVALMKGGNMDGLVIDMRTNGGGAYPILMDCLSPFISGNAGSLTDRNGVRVSLTVRNRPIGNSKSVPLMVLIGRATVSYGEVFAGALHGLQRAKLVGERSGGNIETLRSHPFEDGSVLWLAEETFRLPDGTNWEGEGLLPDISVEKAWDEYSEANDPVIAAAANALTIGK